MEESQGRDRLVGGLRVRLTSPIHSCHKGEEEERLILDGLTRRKQRIAARLADCDEYPLGKTSTPSGGEQRTPTEDSNLAVLRSASLNVHRTGAEKICSSAGKALATPRVPIPCRRQVRWWDEAGKHDKGDSGRKLREDLPKFRFAVMGKENNHDGSSLLSSSSPKSSSSGSSKFRISMKTSSSPLQELGGKPSQLQGERRPRPVTISSSASMYHTRKFSAASGLLLDQATISLFFPCNRELLVKTQL